MLMYYYQVALMKPYTLRQGLSQWLKQLATLPLHLMWLHNQVAGKPDGVWDGGGADDCLLYTLPLASVSVSLQFLAFSLYLLRASIYLQQL